LIVELSKPDLRLNVPLLCEQLVVLDEVVVQDAARVAAVLNLVLGPML
jgi:hypothetical protein